jgi:benzoylformate decarboxylase
VRQSARQPPPPRKVEPARPGKMITADLLYERLHEVRPDDAVIVQETPSNAAVLRKRVPTSRSRSYFAMSGGNLGYGLPAAVGVALAERQMRTGRKVIAVLGDGAAQYGIHALWTAARENLPILFIIVRNGEYAILKAFGELQNAPDVPGLDIPGIDYVHLAEGYGCKASRVSAPGELPLALRESMAARSPAVVEVEIDPRVPKLLASG